MIDLWTPSTMSPAPSAPRPSPRPFWWTAPKRVIPTPADRLRVAIARALQGKPPNGHLPLPPLKK